MDRHTEDRDLYKGRTTFSVYQHVTSVPTHGRKGKGQKRGAAAVRRGGRNNIIRKKDDSKTDLKMALNIEKHGK